jgi:argininosuccinate synthase
LSDASIKKVVLAYSGGLDTSVIIRWMRDKYDCEVIGYAADLGQQEDLKPVKDKGIKTGATDVIVEDLREIFLTEYCIPALAAGALYERQYPLATALGRPLIAKKLVETAHRVGADTVAHGSTGKGNDQVRFDVSVMALDPDLQIIAPVRHWEFKSRNEEIDYAKKHEIPVEATREKPYSIDRNIWGISIECGVLEDPWAAPPADIYQITQSPENAPDKPVMLEIGFEKGIPVSLDGKTYPLVKLVEELNKIGGEHGVGRIDMVENRLVGIKSREIYEAPAAAILLNAHQELEKLVLDREALHYKQSLSDKYAELVYYGQWFTLLRKSLDASIKSLQEVMTGTVRLKLYKGNVAVVGRKSPNSLYDLGLATYDESDTFDHKDGEAFCKIWGLPYKIDARRKKK